LISNLMLRSEPEPNIYDAAGAVLKIALYG
jgi:hypothetical protein